MPSFRPSSRAERRAQSRWGTDPLELEVDAVTVRPTDLRRVLVTIAGRWTAPLPADPATPVLVVDDGELSHCFVALPPDAAGEADDTGHDPLALRAVFSVPDELAEHLHAPQLLDLGVVTVPVPGAPRPASVAAPVPPRAVAPAPEPRSEARPESTPPAVPEPPIRPRDDRVAELESRLAERERELRAADQRVHAERRRAEELVAEERERARRRREEVAALQDRLAAAERTTATLSEQLESLRRAGAEAEQAAAAALAEAQRERAGLGERERALAARERELRGAEARERAEAASSRARLEEVEARGARERAEAAQTMERLADAGELILGRLASERATFADSTRLFERQVAELQRQLDAALRPARQDAAAEHEPGNPDASWLGPGLARLAEVDPPAAAALALELLPAQACAAPLEYDVVVEGSGVHAVSVGPVGAGIQALERYRPARRVDLRLHASPAALVALLAGGGEALAGRGDVRVRATWRRRRALGRLPAVSLDVAGLAAAGVRPVPSRLYAALAALVDPAWTAGMGLCVAHDVEGPAGGTVYLRSGDSGLRASEAPPDRPPAARVRSSRAHLESMLTGAPPPPGDRAAISGDPRAAAAVHRWLVRARAGAG